MKNKQTNLQRAERKVKQHHKRQWCGVLTPSEALAILDDGAQEHQSSMYHREYLQDKKDKGDSRPQWFYFYPSKEQQKRWGKKKMKVQPKPF